MHKSEEAQFRAAEQKASIERSMRLLVRVQKELAKWPDTYEADAANNKLLHKIERMVIDLATKVG